MSATCRDYGIGRPAFYKWLHRYASLGEDGLRDRSSALRRSPNATQADIVGKIVHLRRGYHFGPHKVSMYLRRITTSPSVIPACGRS